MTFVNQSCYRNTLFLSSINDDVPILISIRYDLEHMSLYVNSLIIKNALVKIILFLRQELCLPNVFLRKWIYTDIYWIFLALIDLIFSGSGIEWIEIAQKYE